MGQRDYGCPYNDRVHPEWRDLHSRALPVAPRAACGACSTPLTGAGTAPTTDRRQMRAFSARYGDGYLSLSHKGRACLGAGPALEIMVYAAELPLSAA